MLLPLCIPTQSEPAPYRTWCGRLPTRIFAEIAFVAGSIRLTVLSNSLVAQTEPAPNSTSHTLAPTGMCATTCRVAGSTRSTAPVP